MNTAAGEWHPVSEVPKEAGTYLGTSNYGNPVDLFYWDDEWHHIDGERQQPIAWAEINPYEGVLTCPFGCDAVVRAVDNEKGLYCFCDKCGLGGPEYKTKAEAIAAWNRIEVRDE